MTAIETFSGWPSLGLIPYFADAILLPAEDAIPRQRLRHSSEKRRVKIVAPVLPHIANFDDLDPLAAEADVNLAMITRGTVLPNDADLIILSGIQGDPRRYARFSRRGLGHRYKGTYAPGRKRTRPLRWLPIAGPHDCGSTRRWKSPARFRGWDCSISKRYLRAISLCCQSADAQLEVAQTWL